MFAVLFSPYFPLVFLQPSSHTTLKHFRKFRTRLQSSKVLRLSACFRIVKVFGLPMGIIVHLQVLQTPPYSRFTGYRGVAVANIIEKAVNTLSGHIETLKGPGNDIYY